MVTGVRRVFWLGLLGGAGYTAWMLWQRQSTPAPAAAPEWPPMPTPAPAEPSQPWVGPVDGRCPDGYPIKANDNSGIYHVPGGRFYERTVPERCYADTDAAEADGYRAAKA